MILHKWNGRIGVSVPFVLVCAMLRVTGCEENFIAAAVFMFY